MQPHPNRRASSPYFIAEWSVGERNICLFREENSFAFSADGRRGTKTRFEPNPQNLQFAVNISLLFRGTIAANLQSDETNSFSFIPLLVQEIGENQSKVHIALFGRVSAPTQEEPLGGLRGLRWGMYHLSSREETILEVDDFCTQEFVRWAICSSLDLEGNFSPEKYREYLNHFSLQTDRDRVGNIQHLFLTFQRSSYESTGRPCKQVLNDFLFQPDNLEHLNILRHLGLAPHQIAAHYTEVELSYFRSIFSELDNRSQGEQECIFANLEAQYPSLFPILLQELLERNRVLDQAAQREYETILTSLKQDVVGQEKAAELLATAIKSQRQTDGRSVYLFVGPTGVGKTEISKSASKLKQNRFVKFDMDQFKGEVDHNKLFGSAVGYVGSTDRPFFAKELERYATPLIEGNAIIQRIVSDAVILFDELEKAHSQVKQSLLTLFEEGYCKVQYTIDRRNLIVEYIFKKCIFIGTSNLYREQIQVEFQRNTPLNAIAERFIQLNQQRPLPQSFSPELLGRMKVVPFSPISRENYRILARTKLPSLIGELKNCVNCPIIEIAENDLQDVIQLLEARLYGDGTGMRKLKQFFEQEVKTVIYRQMEWGNLNDKRLTFVSNHDQIGIQCKQVIYGKIVREFPVVSIE